MTNEIDEHCDTWHDPEWLVSDLSCVSPFLYPRANNDELRVATLAKYRAKYSASMWQKGAEREHSRKRIMDNFRRGLDWNNPVIRDMPKSVKYAVRKRKISLPLTMAEARDVWTCVTDNVNNSPATLAFWIVSCVPADNLRTYSDELANYLFRAIDRYRKEIFRFMVFNKSPSWPRSQFGTLYYPPCFLTPSMSEVWKCVSPSCFLRSILPVFMTLPHLDESGSFQSRNRSFRVYHTFSLLNIMCERLSQCDQLTTEDVLVAREMFSVAMRRSLICLAVPLSFFVDRATIERHVRQYILPQTQHGQVSTKRRECAYMDIHTTLDLWRIARDVDAPRCYCRWERKIMYSLDVEYAMASTFGYIKERALFRIAAGRIFRDYGITIDWTIYIPHYIALQREAFVKLWTVYVAALAKNLSFYQHSIKLIGVRNSDLA